MIRHLMLAGMVLAAGLLGGCNTNPATGKLQFNTLSRDEEIQIGSEAEPQFITESGGEIPDATVQAYVSAIGKKLAAVSERPDMPWAFHAVNSPIVNAFALPGGKVFITRGLMEKLHNEAEIAAVLGHECGHVNAEHIGQQMSRQMVLSGVLQAAGAVSDSQWIGTLGGAGGQLYLLKFGRDQESQADELGLRYMTKAGYDPHAMLGVMEVLKSLGNSGLEMLQTHPLPETRIERVTHLLDTGYRRTVNNPSFVLKPDAYQTSVLARLKKLPPAPQPKQQ